MARMCTFIENGKQCTKAGRKGGLCFKHGDKPRCSFDQCDSLAWAKGMCQKHAQPNKKDGKPRVMYNMSGKYHGQKAARKQRQEEVKNIEAGQLLQAGIMYLTERKTIGNDNALELHFLKSELDKDFHLRWQNHKLSGTNVQIDMKAADDMKNKWMRLTDCGEMDMWQVMQMSLSKSLACDRMPNWAKKPARYNCFIDKRNKYLSVVRGLPLIDAHIKHWEQQLSTMESSDNRLAQHKRVKWYEAELVEKRKLEAELKSMLEERPALKRHLTKELSGHFDVSLFLI